MVKLPIIALKGGVGKSTITLNLADLLSQKFKVLVIDTDPQNSISFLLCKKLKEGLSDIFIEKLPVKNAIQNSFEDGFNFIPCGIDAIKHFNIYEENFTESNIKKVLSEVSDYDIVLFDTPPQISKISDTLIEINDICLFVTTPEPASVASFKVFLEYLDTKNISNIDFRTVVNKLEPQSLNEDFYMYIKSLVNNIIMVLPKDTKVVEAEANCTTVFRLEEESAFLEFLLEGGKELISLIKKL